MKFPRLWPVLVTVLTCLCLALPAQAQQLYKQYTWKMGRPEVASLSGAENFPTTWDERALCSYNEKFLGFEWGILFQFHKDRLIQVCLFREFEEIVYLATLEAIGKKFTLVAMQSFTDSFDAVEAAQQGKTDQLWEFQKSGLQTFSLDLFFIESSLVQKCMDGTKNYDELMSKLPIETRQVRVVLSKLRESPHLSLFFHIPKALKKLKLELPDSINEDF